MDIAELLFNTFCHQKGQLYSLQDEEGNYKPAKDADGKYLFLDVDVVRKHLAGEITVSIQPIQYGTNKVRFGCIDFDSKSEREALTETLKELLRLHWDAVSENITTYIEFSGRRGWHVYIFCETAVPAKIMRDFMKKLADRCQVNAKEVFPYGNFVDEKYYPLPIKLPYGIHKGSGRRTGFVYPWNVSWDGDYPVTINPEDILPEIKRVPIEKIVKWSSTKLAGDEDDKYIPVDWSVFGKTLPPCIKILVDSGVPHTMEFNKSCMTLARYSLNRKIPDNIVNKLADNMISRSAAHPTSKRSFSEKKSNFYSAYYSMKKNPLNHRWSCAYVWSNKELGAACENCPLKPNRAPSGDTSPATDPAVTAETSTAELSAENTREINIMPLLKLKDPPAECNLICVDDSIAERYLSDLLSEKEIAVTESDGSLLIFNKGTVLSLSGELCDHYQEKLDILFKAARPTKICFKVKPIIKKFTSGCVAKGLFDLDIAYRLLHAGEEGMYYTFEEMVLQELWMSSPSSSLSALVVYPELRAILQSKLEQAALVEVNKMEQGLVPVLARIEKKGLRLDGAVLKLKAVEYDTRKQQLLREIIIELGEINPSSPDQVLAALKKKGLTIKSTSAVELLKHESRFPIVKKIIEYRSVSNILSTLSKDYSRFISPATKRVHTTYNQLLVTGRMSSEEPNVMGFPKGDFRTAIVPEPDYCLISTDYSQIDLRCLAELSDDQAMIEVFRNGEDIHVATASTITGKRIGDVTQIERKQAKAINYGVVFNMQPAGLMNYAHSKFGVQMTFQEAEKYVAAYFNKHKGVTEYHKQLQSLVSDRRETRTLAGRRRLFNSVKFEMSNIKENYDIALEFFKLFTFQYENNCEQGIIKATMPDWKAERLKTLLEEHFKGPSIKYEYVPFDLGEVYNSPVQGSTADICKTALLFVAAALETRDGAIVNHAHDELLCEVPFDGLDQLEIIEREMLRAAEVYLKKVPVKITSHVGYYWG